MDRRTKIVATVGPATNDEQTLTSLIQAGVDVVRLNFSHGSYEEHSARIALVRKISEDLERPITLLQDLQGPKIRTGEVENDCVTLMKGQPVTLTTEEIVGDESRIPVDYPRLPGSVRPGSRILLDDGNLELVVVSVDKHDINTQVVLGGELRSHKGINLPGALLNIPGFTKKDEADLKFGLEHEIDAVAMSFVRNASDVNIVRQHILEFSPDRKNMPIIAKLERPEALDNLHAIIEASDGVMVARGDLGVEMPPEKVPLAQKEIIEAANLHAKVVITATQMLDSMIHNPRPTRAEASDVANAIFDGSDAVMLSGETAIGKYPVQSVEIMAAIIQQAETELMKWGHWEGDMVGESEDHHALKDVTHDDALAITRAARGLANDRDVAAIAVFTQTGRTAQLMSKARPRTPILAFTPVEATYRRLPMLWGVIPYLVPYADTVEDMLKHVEDAIVSATPIQQGQQVVLISGFPVGALCPPNMALLHTIGKWVGKRPI